MAEGNSVMDEIRAQHQKMKGKTPKEKFLYFWDYYRIPTIVAIVIAALVGNLIYTIVTAKDTAFAVVLINGYTDTDTEAYMSGFETFAQIDTKEYSTNMEANFTIDPQSSDQYAMANLQKLMALVAAKELDVIIADEDTLLNYAQAGYFYDLNDVLSQETLAKYEGSFLYYDLPEDTKGEVPVAVRVTEVPLLAQTQAYAHYEDAWLGVVVNSENLEYLEDFLRYLENTPAIPST